MDNKIIVQARIPNDVLKKLESISRIPRREWHKRNVPDYFGGFIARFTETVEFQILQKESEHRRLIIQKDSELRAALAEASNAKFHLTLKNVELDSLKKQIEELRGSKAA